MAQSRTQWNLKKKVSACFDLAGRQTNKRENNYLLRELTKAAADATLNWMIAPVILCVGTRRAHLKIASFTQGGNAGIMSSKQRVTFWSLEPNGTRLLYQIIWKFEI